LQDFVVPESQNPKPLGAQETGANFIAAIVRVLSAIDFNHNLRSQIREIDHIRADRHLPFEL
jgi:hypothetical protein